MWLCSVKYGFRNEYGKNVRCQNELECEREDHAEARLLRDRGELEADPAELAGEVEAL
jgi:hypothetical protein